MTDTQDLVQELRKLGSIREDAPLKCRVKIQEAADRIEELEGYNHHLIMGHDYQCNARDGLECDCGLQTELEKQDKRIAELEKQLKFISDMIISGADASTGELTIFSISKEVDIVRGVTLGMKLKSWINQLAACAQLTAATELTKITELESQLAAVKSLCTQDREDMGVEAFQKEILSVLYF